MKEVYANSISTIKYIIMVDGVPTVATGDVTVSAVDSAGHTWLSAVTATATANTGEYKVLVPPSSVAQHGILTVTWTFSVATFAINQVEEYNIVFPYADWSQFVEQGITYADFIEREAVSRYVIERFCGQKFFKEINTYNVYGNSGQSLFLPRKLLELNSVVSDTFNDDFSIDTEWQIYGDGELLKQHGQGRRSLGDRGGFFGANRELPRDRKYIVSGTWGWNSIPAEVIEAANILVADMICDQHTYRDRYLKSVKFDKWSIDFMPDAFETTGNVLADQLLEEYRLLPNVGMI